MNIVILIKILSLFIHFFCHLVGRCHIFAYSFTSYNQLPSVSEFLFLVFADNAGVIVNPKGEMKGIIICYICSMKCYNLKLIGNPLILVTSHRFFFFF